MFSNETHLEKTLPIKETASASLVKFDGLEKAFVDLKYREVHPVAFISSFQNENTRIIDSLNLRNLVSTKS